MKIIQVCDRYYPNIGGIETHVKEISEMLVKRGFNVEVVCTDPTGKLPKKEILNGVKVTRFWAFAPNDSYHLSPQIYTYIKKQKYDIIHAHNYHSLVPLFASLAAKKNFVFTAHAFGSHMSFMRKIMHVLYKPIAKYFIIDKSVIIISVTIKERDLLLNNFNLHISKIVTIPLPININNSIIKYNYTPSIIKIGYLGRLSENKNVDKLILAFRIIKEKFKNCELDIAGDGPLKNRLQEMSKSDKEINFLGGLTHDKSLHFLSTLDVFVLPSKFEVSSISVFESMAAGVPVVLTPVGELPQLFENGRHCLFARINDSNDLADKIEILIENRALAMELVKNGRLEVENRDINKIIKKYIDTYTEIIETSSIQVDAPP